MQIASHCQPGTVATRSGRRKPVIIPLQLLLACHLLLAGCSTAPTQRGKETQPGPISSLATKVADDYRQGYSAEGLLDLLPHVAVHGVLSNSSLDQEIRDKWQQDMRGAQSDKLAEAFINFGDYAQNRWSIPLYTATLLASGYTGQADQDSAVSTWAERSLRANILGGPQAWALTYAIGSHRPDPGGSGWNPWNDNDGVSGHSFYGAVPFLTAARMTENDTLRYSLYFLSTFPGLARIHDDHHYTSQAYLGWAIALNATATVAREGKDGSQLTVLPLPDGGIALVLSTHFW